MRKGYLVINGRRHAVTNIDLTVSNPNRPLERKDFIHESVTLSGQMTVQFDEVGFRRWQLESQLREAKVSEAIIERVMRLNPDPHPGARLRGIHYKRAFGPSRYEGWCSRSQVIREYGRDAWDEIDPRYLRKHGRRQFAAWGGISAKRFAQEYEA